MNRFKKILWLLCFSLAVTGSAWSQLKFEKPVLITKENGLPTHEIQSIRKGEDGFVWIATLKGLCRFDGQQMKIFRQGTDLKYSLFDDYVQAVQPIKNKIWIGTSQGLSVLNTSDNTFRHYQFSDKGKTDSLKRRFDQNVHTLYCDKNNN